MSPPFPLPGVRAEDRSSQRQEEHEGDPSCFGKKRNLDALLMQTRKKKSKKNDTTNAFNEREECLSFNNDDEEVLNDGVVVERSDDNAKFEKEEERRRRRERSEKKSLVLKRWAKLSEDLVLLRRRSGRRSEDNEEEKDEEKMNGTGEERFERLMRVAYAYRCSVKQKNERRRRRGRGGYGVSERGLLAQRRAMHNTVLHGIAERSIHLADNAGAEDDTEEKRGALVAAGAIEPLVALLLAAEATTGVQLSRQVWCLRGVEAVEAFRNHHMSSGTPPRDRSRPPRNREALEKLEKIRGPLADGRPGYAP